MKRRKSKSRARPRSHSKVVRTKHGRKRIIVNRHIIKRNKKKVSVHKSMKNPDEVPVALRKKIVEQGLGSMAAELKRLNRVRIPSFGILRVKTKPAKKARMGINPFTKEKMRFKARPKMKVVKFRPGKKLKTML